MARLKGSDYRALLELCQGLYSTLDTERFVKTTLERLPRLIPCDAITYNEMCPSEDSSRDVDFPKGVLNIANWPHVMHDHPVLTYILQTGDGTAHKLSDFMTRRQLRETGLYDEVYKVAGVESGLCVALEIFKTERPVVIGMGLHRGRVDFSERDRLVLNLLRPHLVQAYQNAVAASHLGWVLDAEGRGVIALNSQHRIRLITRRAQSWLTEYLGWTDSERDRLPSRVNEWLRSHLQISKDQVPAPREPLVLTKGTKRLVIRLIETDREPTLHLEEQYTAIPAEALRPLNVSRREAEVLAWMAVGKTNADIAQILGVSARTVEKHCENIYQKLGVESRMAAVRRALDCAPRLVQF